MLSWKISGPRATVTVADHKNLLGVWRMYGGLPARDLLGDFIVRKPLTEAQLRRLPAELRDRTSSPDGLAFFERLYGLEDPR